MAIETRFDARDMWVRMFDPATSGAAKKSVEDEFRMDILKAVRNRQEGRMRFDGNEYSVDVPLGYDLTRLRRCLERVEENTLVVAVMSGGYGPARLVYSELECMRKSSSMVLVGYSKDADAKRFSDGSRMGGSIFASSHDTAELFAHNGPILLVENSILSGTTVVTLSSNLIRLGASGQMYRLDAGCYHGPFILDEWDAGWDAEKVSALPVTAMHDEKGNAREMLLISASRD